MTPLAIVLGTIILLVAIYVLIGMFSKKEYKGTKSETVALDRRAIWRYLEDIEDLPKRRKEIKRVEVMNPDEELKEWREYTDMGGFVSFRQFERIPDKKLVVQMEASTFGMSGTWTYNLEDAEEGTVVTIQEESQVNKIPIRAMMTLVGRDANLKREFKLLNAFASQEKAS